MCLNQTRACALSEENQVFSKWNNFKAICGN